MEPKGRIFQDRNFDVNFVEGCEVEEILGLVDINDPDDQPIIVNMHVRGLGWQRYFLDAYIGFWEDWGELTDEEEEDETKVVDYGIEFDLKGKIIQSAKCIECKIVVIFKGSGSLELSLVNSEEDDTESIIRYRPSYPDLQ